MAISAETVTEIVAVALAEAANVIPAFGSADKVSAAQTAINAAATTASTFLTDPTQQAEASASYTAANSILKLIQAFTSKL